MQLLKNAFKVCGKWRNADVICYKLTPLVSLQQRNVKKSKNLMKIDENSEYWQRSSSYLLNDLKNFNKIFRKDATYDNIKSRKQQDFTLSLEDTLFEKSQGGGQFEASRFRVKVRSRFSIITCIALVTKVDNKVLIIKTIVWIN